MTLRPPMVTDQDVSSALDAACARLLAGRAAASHWEGRLSSSALSTATAALALHITAREGDTDERLRAAADRGATWLIANQNADGGWGDTVRSRSNISTTAIAWAALSTIGAPGSARAIDGAAHWLHRAAGDTSPESLRQAILRRYGKDRTFSVPILTVLALAGKLGRHEEGWRSVLQLPFELAALPHTWFQHLRLPVVSYALPALIAIGQVRHHFVPSGNPAARFVRNRTRLRTLAILRAMQPATGGYLEATPLTSFVVMSLSAMRELSNPVVREGVRFLLESMSEDGSWPIDTNLSTWVTSLSIRALADAGALPREDSSSMREWLLAQQSTEEHPFTHAAPGAWAWTPLPGGVPDADDTSAAMLALHALEDPDARTVAAASAGARWLLGVQNRDGGIPTFCRGWGALPFDRSTPEITSHALQAWGAWYGHVDPALQARLRTASARALDFLARSQRADGSWVPLWFGNEAADEEANPTYGTSRVLQGLFSPVAGAHAVSPDVVRRAIDWLIGAQNADGGWGGATGVHSSVEETGVALAALAVAQVHSRSTRLEIAVTRGREWLASSLSAPLSAAPIGLYFARLWYFEQLYPLVFGVSGLAGSSISLEDRARPVDHSDGRVMA